MPSDRRSRMSMNNEARNLRLSILLFFQPSARLASARQSGPHTRIGCRSSMHARVCVRPRCARPHTLSHLRVWASAFVWIARTFRKQSSCLARESSSALGAATRPMHRYRKRRDTRRKKGRETCCCVCVCTRARVCVCVWRDGEDCTYVRPTYTRHEYLRRERYAFSSCGRGVLRRVFRCDGRRLISIFLPFFFHALNLYARFSTCSWWRLIGMCIANVYSERKKVKKCAKERKMW